MIHQTPPLNAVLIGLGMVADMHVAAIKATGGLVRLSGVCARRSDAARAFAQRHGGLRVYTDIDAILADKAVDFIILATPPDARQAYVDACARAGLPILMEKPIERDHARARTLVETCEAANVPLGIVLQHRMRPAAGSLAKRIAHGDLGQIATVDVRIPWWRDQSYYNAPGRGTFDRDGGGVLITQAIHTLDLMLRLCGPVATVQGLVATSALHTLEAEDFAGALLTLRSGASGTIMASTTHFPGGTESITLNGTLASAVLSADNLRIHRHDGRVEETGSSGGTGGGADPMAFSSDWHQAVIEDFAKSLAEGRPPAITGRSALGAHALIDAIIASSRSGTRIAAEVQDG